MTKAFILLLLWWVCVPTINCSAFSNYFSKCGYINVAKDTKVSATATCGDEGREKYFVDDGDWFSFKGPTAYCDQTDPALSTAPENVIDGTDRVWQSPPPTEHANLTTVNLTLDLGQEMSIQFITIEVGNSTFPGIWVLERSIDFGRTWSPWQYYAPDSVLCEKYFGTWDSKPSKIESVVCDTRFPNGAADENEEILFSPLEGRDTLHGPWETSRLLQWTKATNLRLRLLKHWFEQNTLQRELEELGLKYEVHPALYKFLYYSIKEIGVWIKPECNIPLPTCDQSEICCQRELFCNCLCFTDEYCEEICSE